jgi:hypothetical protein
MNEFNHRVFTIFERLDYCKITDNNLLKNDVIIEKETIQFVVRILYKKERELVTKYEIELFNVNLLNHYDLKGYLITNTKFDIDYSNNLYIFDNRIRLFDYDEIQRLSMKK